MWYMNLVTETRSGKVTIYFTISKVKKLGEAAMGWLTIKFVDRVVAGGMPGVPGLDEIDSLDVHPGAVWEDASSLKQHAIKHIFSTYAKESAGDRPVKLKLG